MSYPGSARPDLCSIRTADEQDELAEAVRGGFSAVGYPPGDNHPPVPLTGDIDRAIRLSTAAAVLAVAAIAAYISYWHAYAVVLAHGESGITARLEPATIDGLVYASSMVVLSAARHRIPVPSLARWLLGLGIAATLTANLAQGWSHGLVGAVVAAWPAVSLVGSYELLVWLIRISGTAEHRPLAGHLGYAAACRGQLKGITGRPLVVVLDNPGNRMPLSPPNVIFAMYGDPEFVFSADRAQPGFWHASRNGELHVLNERGIEHGSHAHLSAIAVVREQPAGAGRPGRDDGRLRDHQRPVLAAARLRVRARGGHAVGRPEPWPVRPAQRRHAVSRNRQLRGRPTRRALRGPRRTGSAPRPRPTR